MHFLPDVYVTCDVCHGKRYNRETLDVHFKGKSIADVLDMTVEEGVEFFDAVPSVRDKLQALFDVGLGYIKVGQQANTLSGGEAQRVKLAKELSKRSTGVRSTFSMSRPPACISMTSPSCSKCCTNWSIRKFRHRHRAQSRSHQDGRLDPRFRSGRRRRGRTDRGRRHAGGYREGRGLSYRAFPQGTAGAPAGSAQSGC